MYFLVEWESRGPGPAKLDGKRVQADLLGRPAETQQPAFDVDAAALQGRREVKVKLPASHVLRLYYLKITSNLNYSDVVEDALGRYFAELDNLPVGARLDDA